MERDLSGPIPVIITHEGHEREKALEEEERMRRLNSGSEFGEEVREEGRGREDEEEGAFDLDSLGEDSDSELVGLTSPLGPGGGRGERKAPASAGPVSVVLWRQLLLGLLYTVLWFTFSTCLSIYNRWMMGQGEGYRNFKYPFMMTTCHFLVQFLLSALVLACVPSLRPQRGISWRDYLTRVVPSGMATSLDIGLSNLSFKFITLSFYTMCKSSSPVFLLGFAFLFGLEKLSWKLVGIIGVITGGIILTVMGEAEFDPAGFALIMSAAFFAGLRWTITQVLLQKEKLGINNTFATLFYITPVMAAVLFALAIPFERLWEIFLNPAFNTPAAALETMSLIGIGAIIAFCMVTAEFQLIKQTSAVTFMIIGIVKEVLTIIVSVILFDDKLGPVNIVGLCFVILGVSLYNAYKYQKQKASASSRLPTVVPKQRFPNNDDDDEGHGMFTLTPVRRSQNGH